MPGIFFYAGLSGHPVL